MTVCPRKRAAAAQALVAAPAGLRRAHRGVKSPTTPMIFCGPTGSEGDLVCAKIIDLRAVREEVNQVGAEFNSGDLGDVRSDDEREKISAAVDIYEVDWW